jgi:hypothetical protein
MRKTAAIAVLTLCAGFLQTAHAAGSFSLAERSGFLLGAARHCGVSHERVVRVGQHMMTAIAADARDTELAEAAGKRFVQFFEATSTATDGNGEAEPTVKCEAVSTEFGKLEQHTQPLPLKRTVRKPAIRD